jgi:hypothetical protein
MGSELKMSTAFRPQTDGQTKRVNLVIQQLLRNYVAADQQDWVDHLCRNPNFGLATKARGCKVAGQVGDPRTLHMLPGVQRV